MHANRRTVASCCWRCIKEATFHSYIKSYTCTPGTKTLFRDCPLTYKPVLFCSANRLIEVIYGSSTCSHRQFQLYVSSPPSTIALSLESVLRDILHVTTIWYSNGAMAEWSKAVDLSLHDILYWRDPRGFKPHWHHHVFYV